MQGICYISVNSRAACRAILAVALLAIPCGVLRASEELTSQQKEDFLRKAKITKAREAKKGTSGTSQVTLQYGTLTHDASVQTMDDYKQRFLGEVGFKDTYKFNIAAWKLAKLVGIEDMVPPSVRRTYDGHLASFTWWVEDVVMDEEDRRAKNIQPPDPEAWNQQSNIMQVFDQLIYNVDENQTNLLIDKSWHLWLIDHSRSFRVHKSLKDPSVLKAIDRTMLAKMKTLDQATLTREFGKDVSKDEIQGLLARRDLIVKVFEDKGESAIFDRSR